VGDRAEAGAVEGDSGSLYSAASFLAKSPLGIIALSLVLVYAMAAVVVFGASSLDASSRSPLIWFLVGYPVLVLLVFMWLIARHPNRLYGPRDFRDDGAFLATSLGQLESVAYLASARALRAGKVDSGDDREVAGVVEAVVRGAQVRRRGQVLWVDDHPENTVWERGAFRSIGVDVRLALTTEQGLEALDGGSFGLVISDMAREEGPREGYALLDEMRRRGDRTPLVFYSSSSTPEQVREARRHGGLGSVSDPAELYDLTLAVVAAPADLRSHDRR